MDQHNLFNFQSELPKLLEVLQIVLDENNMKSEANKGPDFKYLKFNILI